jgi:hypothetical protein
MLHESDAELLERYPLPRLGDYPTNAFCWRAEHGPASVLYHQKMPVLVLNARLEDGSRARIGTANGPPGWRRVAATPLRYKWGKIEVGLADVLFLERAIHSYNPPPLIDRNGMPSLEGHLARDSAFVEDLKDQRLAHLAWQILDHVDLVRLDGQEFGYFGGDAAAMMIAGLRGLGEDDSDFILYDVPDGEPDERQLGGRFFDHLARLAWRRNDEWWT